MKYTNILEKLNCLFNIIKDNWIYLVFLGFVVIILLLVNFKKISRKTGFLVSLTSYITLLGYMIIIYNKQLGTIGNSIMDNLFMSIYFPSAYVYLFILIVIDIVTFVSLMNNRRSKVYHWIHSIFFFTIQFIFILILELLSKNKIDIFTKTSLFSNKDLIMLLELSINVFILWIITLTFVYFTNMITEKVTLSEMKKKNIPNTNVADMTTLVADINLNTNTVKEEEKPLPVVASITQPEITTPVNVLPITNVPVVETTNIAVPTVENSVINTTVQTPEVTPVIMEEKEQPFTLNEFIPTQTEVIIPEPVLVEETNNNTSVEIAKEIKEDNPETRNYTLNDYRLFNKMLMDIKEHNQNNTVTIDKDLEYRLITKYSTENYNMFKKMLQIYSH